MGGTQENLVAQAINKWKDTRRELDRLPHQQAGTPEGARALKLKDQLRSQANEVRRLHDSYKEHMSKGDHRVRPLSEFGFNG